MRSAVAALLVAEQRDHGRIDRRNGRGRERGLRRRGRGGLDLRRVEVLADDDDDVGARRGLAEDRRGAARCRRRRARPGAWSPRSWRACSCSRPSSSGSSGSRCSPCPCGEDALRRCACSRRCAAPARRRGREVDTRAVQRDDLELLRRDRRHGLLRATRPARPACRRRSPRSSTALKSGFRNWRTSLDLRLRRRSRTAPPARRPGRRAA